MIVVNELVKLPPASEYYAILSLPFELRQKSRLRTRLDNDEEIALMLPRGTILRGGDFLRTGDNRVVLVQAQPELVSTVCCDDKLLFARVCYHLGNRHVALQIESDFLRYTRDHVLDALAQSFGLSIEHECAPFEPEAGAYQHGH